MNIGLFGGTFNPFHNGHIGIIQHVQKLYNLKKLFLIPSATPPHKPDINLAPAKDRFLMVKESLKEYTGFQVSDKELIRKGLSYTIDTITEFKKEYDSETRFYLLMGSDAFLDIDTWKHKDQIFKEVRIIIMLRGHWKDYSPIVSFIDEHISKGYIFNEQNNAFCKKNRQKITLCKVPKIDISSTMIRDRVRCNQSIKGFVPEIVETIIKTKDLYK